MKFPTLNVRDIEDSVASKNFEALNRLLAVSPFFKMDGEVREIEISQGTNKYRHSLGYTPKDIILSYNKNNSQLVFNYENFDDIFISITSSAATIVRCIIGRIS